MSVCSRAAGPAWLCPREPGLGVQELHRVTALGQGATWVSHEAPPARALLRNTASHKRHFSPKHPPRGRTDGVRWPHRVATRPRTCSDTAPSHGPTVGRAARDAPVCRGRRLSEGGGRVCGQGDCLPRAALRRLDTPPLRSLSFSGGRGLLVRWKRGDHHKVSSPTKPC